MWLFMPWVGQGVPGMKAGSSVKSIWREIWRILLAFVISIISIDFIEPKSKTVAGICFVVLFLILWIVLEYSTKYVLREDIKKYSEEFKKICDEANDEVAFNVWKSKMDKIIG